MFHYITLSYSSRTFYEQSHFTMSLFFPVKELLIYFPLQDYSFCTFLSFLTDHILHLFEIF